MVGLYSVLFLTRSLEKQLLLFTCLFQLILYALDSTLSGLLSLSFQVCQNVLFLIFLFMTYLSSILH